MSAEPVHGIVQGDAHQVFQGETMCFAVLGSFIVVLHTKAAPSEHDWRRYLEAARKISRSGPRMSTLVFTDGGSPSKPQREAITAIFAGRQVPVGVVTPSGAVRFVISSMALFGVNIRSYAPEKWRDAFDHLGLSREEQVLCATAFRELRRSSFGAEFTTWSAAAASF